MKGFDTVVFAERLKKAREENHEQKVSHETMAKELGLSKSGLQNSEIRNRDNKRYGYNLGMSAVNLVKIAQYHKVSTDYLLGLSDDPRVDPPAVDELGLSPEAVSSLREWKRDNPEYLRIINALISDPGFVYALDDLANGLYLASVESGKDSDFADFQWKESEKAVEQIAKLTVDGELTPYKEAFIKVRDNLDLSDCAEIYRQKGIREITYILDMMK